jgi:predicted RecA/RadA family phage recombinase
MRGRFVLNFQREKHMKNFVSDGLNLTVTSPAGGTVSGNFYLIGTNLFGVAVTDSVAGDTVVLRTVGMYENKPKATGAAWAEGDLLYWDNTAKNFTKTSTSNTKVGVAMVGGTFWRHHRHRQDRSRRRLTPAVKPKESIMPSPFARAVAAAAVTHDKSKASCLRSRR